MSLSRIPGRERISHSFVHSPTDSFSANPSQAPSAYMWSASRVCPCVLPPSCPSLQTHHCFAGGAPFGRKFSRKSEVFNPLLASAASSEPWTPSTLAFNPSGPKKTLSKRESPITQRLVSDAFGTSTEISEVGKKPAWGQRCRKRHGLWFFRKVWSFSFTKQSYQSTERFSSAPRLVFETNRRFESEPWAAGSAAGLWFCFSWTDWLPAVRNTAGDSNGECVTRSDCARPWA